ncbi:MAG: ABC transporter substrate-binding protein [bacterium]
MRIAVVRARNMKPYEIDLEVFKARMKKYGYQSAFVYFDMSTRDRADEELRQKINPGEIDLVLALGTEAAQMVKRANLKVPALFSMVSEPAQVGLLNSSSNGETPMTGVSLDIAPEEQFKALLEIVPGVKRIGVIYDPNESEQIVDLGTRAANRLGIGLVTYPVTSEGQVPEGLTFIRPRIDALWLVSDRTVLTTQALQHIYLFAFQTSLPLMGLSDHFVKMGALLAVSPDYEDVGEQSAELAIRILKGEDPEVLPVASPRKTQISLNSRTAQIIGLAIPDRVVRKATTVY